ncbi:hypothetical protein [Plantactinospora sp. GCM10030261]|uniref:hypothetical protein n=1 Tax=Plantactinospora sp. GCM10030261 TaxID=3273420 RepID=UPI003610247D
MRRRIGSLLVVLAGAAAALIGSVDPAHAAPRPTPTSVTISGTGLGEPLVVHAKEDEALFAALLGQVSWLSGAGQGGAPKDADLGHKYTLVVDVEGAAKQTYDLYPLAKGGPRACRPGRTPAWFYGRLNMSETLRAAGVPLPEQAESITGGFGGGDSLVDEDVDPKQNLDRVLGELRRLFLLNAGLIVVLTLGIGGIALLVRRRTR